MTPRRRTGKGSGTVRAYSSRHFLLSALPGEARRLIELALREDLGARGDITTRFFLPPDKTYKGRLLVKKPGVLCGAALVDAVFRRVAPSARIRWLKKDGDKVRAGTTVARLAGPREMLTAERTALNFLQHLSGIATSTAAFVAGTRGTRARVFDTRKTLPGWRTLAKYAVRCGGGVNHRMGLFDMALVKDNHLEGLRLAGRAEATRRVALFRRRHPRVPIEVEAKTHAEAAWALELGADIVLLDNMGVPALRREIRFLRRASPRIQIEISGGVDLSSVRRLARLGADRISVGRITHSAPALDISLELER